MENEGNHSHCVSQENQAVEHEQSSAVAHEGPCCITWVNVEIKACNDLRIDMDQRKHGPQSTPKTAAAAVPALAADANI